MKAETELVAIRIAKATNHDDLKRIGEKIQEDGAAGEWYARDDESIRYLRKVWKARSFEIEADLGCRPHNKPENYVLKDGKVWCKVCGHYVGHPSPQFLSTRKEERQKYE